MSSKLSNIKENPEKKFIDNIKTFQMADKGSKILLSVSGGPDSICLLELFFKFKNQRVNEIVVYHLNHHLRGEEAEQDEEFVRQACLKKNLDYISCEIDIKEYCQDMNLSLQEGARTYRYKQLFEIANEVRADKIALGHNLNDLAETVLINLIRGTGLAGLASLQPVRGKFIRPLLNINRKIIEEYLEEKNIEYRVDSSNLDKKYRRNYVRLDILPKLIELNPRFLENIWNMNKLLEADQKLINSIAHKEFEKLAREHDGYLNLSVQKLGKLDEALANRIIRQALKEIKGDLKSFDYKHIEMIWQLISTGKNNYINLPGEIIVFLSKGKLFFVKKEQLDYLQEPVKLNCPGEVKLEQLGFSIVCRQANPEEVDFSNPNIVYIDSDKIKPPLFIRSRKDGDRFQPFGMDDLKKIQDYFVDIKIPRWKRNRIPVIEDQEGIIWVVGLRTSQRVKINSVTKKIYRFEKINR